MTTGDFLSATQELEPYASRLGDTMHVYWSYHRDRFVFEAKLISRYLDRFAGKGKLRLLDIGPSFQTMLFHRLWKDRVHIDTFGFPDEKFPAPEGGQHFDFDLNDAYFPDRWPRLQPYDIVTMFEVIEHLYTSPVQVLRLVKTLVADRGILVVSTPNAVALPKRLSMVFGKNPFEFIRETRSNPGHYRESTRRELIETGEAAGLHVLESFALNLSSTGTLSSKIFRCVSKFLPCDLRKELTIVFEKA